MSTPCDGGVQSGGTALMLAAAWGYEGNVVRLLAAGADPNATNRVSHHEDGGKKIKLNE